MKDLGLNFLAKASLPMIRQNEAAECGLASLAMVAGYYGYETDLNALRRRYSISIQGMDLAMLMDVADQLALSTNPVKLDLDQIHLLQLPAILHWDMNHFVVLDSVHRGKFRIHDPAFGVRVLDREAFSKHFTGVALELQPSTEFRAKKERTPVRLSMLWSSFTGFKRNLVQVALLSVVAQVFVLATPFYLQVAVDQVLLSRDGDLMRALALGFVGVAVLLALATLLRGYVMLYFGSLMSYQISVNLFRHMLRLPVDYFKKRHVGDIDSRFSSIEPIRKMLTEGIAGSLIDGLMAISTLILMFVYSAKLACITLAAWLLYILLRVCFYRSLRAQQESLIVAKAHEHTNFIETLRGITSVKLFGAELKRLQFWQTRNATAINENARLQRLVLWFEFGQQSLFGVERVLVIYLAIMMVMQGGSFTVGMIFAFIAYRNSFTGNATNLVDQLIEFRLLNLHLERISDITGSKPEVENQPVRTASRKLTGQLECKRLSYRYATGTPLIFDELNLKFDAGSNTAIVGPSGCGKSTLLRLLAGLTKPERGEVLVDGVPIFEFGIAQYRKQIGVVMQDDDLFAGSILSNIAFFDKQVDLERVTEVAKLAQVHDQIEAMPMGYESLIGDMGGALSGGEKQRIMLARALYRQPKILFVDEGTAHLDVETERRVNESLSKMNMTRVVIAHRPETIAYADEVLDLQTLRAAQELED